MICKEDWMHNFEKTGNLLCCQNCKMEIDLDKLRAEAYHQKVDL